MHPSRSSSQEEPRPRATPFASPSAAGLHAQARRPRLLDGWLASGTPRATRRRLAPVRGEGGGVAGVGDGRRDAATSASTATAPELSAGEPWAANLWPVKGDAASSSTAGVGEGRRGDATESATAGLEKLRTPEPKVKTDAPVGADTKASASAATSTTAGVRNGGVVLVVDDNVFPRRQGYHHRGDGVDVQHWGCRTSVQLVGYRWHQRRDVLRGRLKGLHRQRRDGLRGRLKGLRRHACCAVLVVATRTPDGSILHRSGEGRAVQGGLGGVSEQRNAVTAVVAKQAEEQR